MSRTVVVTGGGTGIGKAVAAAFAAQGDRVYITGRRQAPLDQTAAELGELVTGVVCDATDPEQIAALRDKLPEKIDVLVNNAGGNRELDGPPPGNGNGNGNGQLGAVGLSGQTGPKDNLEKLAAHWRENLEANLVSAVLTTAAVDKLLAPGGAVIHIGSFAADRGAGSYGAAKAGMGSWNIFLARQLGPRDITSNVVAPGYIAETEFFRGKNGEEFHNARVAETMTKQAGAPDDIAATVVFLASPGARYITGQIVNVNGGALTTR